MATRNVDLNGPWSAPPRRQHFDNHYLMQIVVFDPSKDDKEMAVQVIDYGSADDRKFLGRLTHWAMENNYVVETSRVNKD